MLELICLTVMLSGLGLYWVMVRVRIHLTNRYLEQSPYDSANLKPTPDGGYQVSQQQMQQNIYKALDNAEVYQLWQYETNATSVSKAQARMLFTRILLAHLNEATDQRSSEAPQQPIPNGGNIISIFGRNPN